MSDRESIPTSAPLIDMDAWLGAAIGASLPGDASGETTSVSSALPPELAELGEVDPEVLAALAFAQLEMMYEMVDEAIAASTAALELPCHKGCDACCRNSVFLTPLEFAYAWRWAQEHLDDDTRRQVITRALALYDEHRELIEAFEQPPPDGADDHYALAKELHFACPLLGPDGGCMIYPARELLSRLFGTSFNDDGGMYGCHLIHAHMEGREATLLTVQDVAAQLRQLPMTHKRQVYPYYFYQLFGASADTPPTQD